MSPIIPAEARSRPDGDTNPPRHGVNGPPSVSVSPGRPRPETDQSPGPVADLEGVWLIGLDGPFEGRAFAIKTPNFSLGRHPSCNLCLASPYVSRVHVLIKRVGDQVLVRDLETRNGTTINGHVGPR